MLEPYNALVGKFSYLTQADKQKLLEFRNHLTGTHNMWPQQWVPIFERAAKIINDMRRQGSRDEVTDIYYSPDQQRHANLMAEITRVSPNVDVSKVDKAHTDFVSVCLKLARR